MPYEMLRKNAAIAPERRLPSGRHMIFRLAGELYAVDILVIREIIGRMETVRVPRTPDFMEGVINLRGRVVPVIDLRKRLGLEPGTDVKRPCIMILTPRGHSGNLTVGVIVDKVLAVHDLDADDVDPPPAFGIREHAAYLMAMAKVEDDVVLVLDVDRLLSSTETEQLHDLTTSSV